MNPADKSDDPLIREAIRLLNLEYDSGRTFNEFFDSDEPVRVGRLELPRSKVLFWLDRVGYYEEQEQWFNDALQEQHEPCISLLRQHGLRTPFDELISAIERDRVVPFIGAGMSSAMNMPIWGVALTELVQRIPGADAEALNAKIDAGEYLEAAEIMAAQDPIQTANFIRTTYRVQNMEFVGPMTLLPKIARGCIITTNFDDAIESVYERDGIRFDAYMHGTQEHRFFPKLVSGSRCLLKLHGDADDPTTHILTQAQYDRGYGNPFDFHKSLPKALRQLFVSQSLLFLGCSLEQDWTLRLFEQAKAADEYAIPNHFAILPAPADAQARQQKATRLLGLNIQPLWYPAGEHEYVERYLQLLIDAKDRRINITG